jgi:hypothetical protein
MNQYGALLECSDRGNKITLRKPCPRTLLSTTNPTWIGLGLNLWLGIETLVANLVSHGTALKDLDLK